LKKLCILAVCFSLTPVLAIAGNVGITKDIMSVTVKHKGSNVDITRDQNNKATINPAFAKTSRKCPPFCIQPMQVAPGVKTVGELELLDFLSKGGFVIDNRTVEWHVKGTIPGAVNIPHTQIASRLNELGCTKGAKWNCSNAKKVLLFCNGMWCGQSPTGIRAMLREGYPPEKILYYRDGMQGWSTLGLTTVEGSL
jgi:rhodanese-related sulfurtransferase